MKEVYVKPEVKVNEYAQFENVYAACFKNPGKVVDMGCHWNAAYSENDGFDYCHHSGLMSSNS